MNARADKDPREVEPRYIAQGTGGRARLFKLAPETLGKGHQGGEIQQGGKYTKQF